MMQDTSKICKCNFVDSVVFVSVLVTAILSVSRLLVMNFRGGSPMPQVFQCPLVANRLQVVPGYPVIRTTIKTVTRYKKLSCSYQKLTEILNFKRYLLPPGPFTTVVSSSGMHETKMGNVTIQVVTGDITKETTDVIVNSTNESFSLKTGKIILF